MWKEEHKAVNVLTGTRRIHQLCGLHHIEQVLQSLASVLRVDSISDEANDHPGTSAGGAEGDIRGEKMNTNRARTDPCRATETQVVEKTLTPDS